MVKNVRLEVIVGVLLFILGNITAFVYHYHRSGTFIVLGLFLFFKGVFRIVKKRELLNSKNFFLIYLAFFVGGLITDLVLGVWLTRLWYYPSYDLVDYFILYLVGYPSVGFLMIYSFSLVEYALVRKPKETRIDYRNSLIFTWFLMFIGLAGALFSLLFVSSYKGFLVYTFGAIAVIGLFDLTTLRVRKDNLLERFLTKSLKYGIIILTFSYLHGLIQELPNLSSKEWIYQNFPFNNITFLGIPITVFFLGWIFIFILPYSIFELILTLNKKAKSKT